MHNVISKMEDIIIKMAWRFESRSHPAVTTLPIGIALHYIFTSQVGLGVEGGEDGEEGFI